MGNRCAGKGDARVPPVACVPTPTARRALESRGYKLIGEDDYNWVFALGPNDIPIIIPHTVPRVPMPIMQRYAHLLSEPPTTAEDEAAIRAETDD
jgi:hypothetical protein